MKILVVYFSQGGNNEKIAKELQEKLDSDIDRVTDSKGKRGFFGGGYSAASKKETQVQFSADPAAYDTVIVVSAVWAGSLPPATRSYLKENRDKFKQAAFVSVCLRGEENRNILTDFEAAGGTLPAASLLIKVSKVAAETTEQMKEAFIKRIQA